MVDNAITLCLTPGDPTGIGPEITVKWLAHHQAHYPSLHLHVIGNLAALEKAANQLGTPLPTSQQIVYQDIPGSTPGEIAYQSLETSVACIASGQAHGLVTGPIVKHHLAAAGIMAAGHTELLTLLCRQYYPAFKSHAQMLFVYGAFRLLLLTRHVPLSRVSATLGSQNNRGIIETLCHFLRDYLGITYPRLALLGVNPHAGELDGVEETLILAPLIAHVHQQGWATVEGPFAADAFFREPDHISGQYDSVVASYHDQGLIPFKLLAGYQAVNVSIGLPFIRTSVGHGAALDIAGQGKATETGLTAAIDTAISLCSQALQIKEAAAC
jgi:4-hydroxythreonine-4-phosphate dehydrogenase